MSNIETLAGEKERLEEALEYARSQIRRLHEEIREVYTPTFIDSDPLNECAIARIREICRNATGGNCCFVDDDVARLVWERDNAEMALDGDREALSKVRKEQADRKRKLENIERDKNGNQ